MGSLDFTLFLFCGFGGGGLYTVSGCLFSFVGKELLFLGQCPTKGPKKGISMGMIFNVLDNFVCYFL